MNIRKAAIDDLTEIMDIYRIAQDYMIESGNPAQWGHFYPQEELIREDISKGRCYLICDDDTPHGGFDTHGSGTLRPNGGFAAGDDDALCPSRGGGEEPDGVS